MPAVCSACVRRKMSVTKTVIASAREGLQTRQASHPSRRIAFSMEQDRSVVDSGAFAVATMWATLADSRCQVTRVLVTTWPIVFATNGRPDFFYMSLPLSRWKCFHFDMGFHPAESQRRQCCSVLVKVGKTCVIDRALKCVSNLTDSQRADTGMPQHAIDCPCRVLHPCILGPSSRVYFCARYSHLKLPTSGDRIPLWLA